MKAEKKTIICPHFFLLTLSQYLAGENNLSERERDREEEGQKERG